MRCSTTDAKVAFVPRTSDASHDNATVVGLLLHLEGHWAGVRKSGTTLFWVDSVRKYPTPLSDAGLAAKLRKHPCTFRVLSL